VDTALTNTLGFVGLMQVGSQDLGGFLLTIIIGVVGIGASLPIGILLALGRNSDMPLIRGLCVIFIEFIRGVPLITLLFVANVVLAYFLPPGTEFDKLLRVLIMVTMFASAYIAEVVRGGLAALPQGQYEAANAMGLDYWKSTRLIVLPQALKISIPGIVNTFIGLFKDTTLVSIIALFDPLGIIAPIRAHQDWNGLVWEPYLFVAAFFFIFCFGMSRYSMYLERKLEKGH
jgi:general L-amino acid transport system permease protein